MSKRLGILLSQVMAVSVLVLIACLLRGGGSVSAVTCNDNSGSAPALDVNANVYVHVINNNYPSGDPQHDYYTPYYSFHVEASLPTDSIKVGSNDGGLDSAIQNTGPADKYEATHQVYSDPTQGSPSDLQTRVRNVVRIDAGQETLHNCATLSDGVHHGPVAYDFTEGSNGLAYLDCHGLSTIPDPGTGQDDRWSVQFKIYFVVGDDYIKDQNGNPLGGGTLTGGSLLFKPTATTSANKQAVRDLVLTYTIPGNGEGVGNPGGGATYSFDVACTASTVAIHVHLDDASNSHQYTLGVSADGGAEAPWLHGINTVDTYNIVPPGGGYNDTSPHTFTARAIWQSGHDQQIHDLGTITLPACEHPPTGNLNPVVCGGSITGSASDVDLPGYPISVALYYHQGSPTAPLQGVGWFPTDINHNFSIDLNTLNNGQFMDGNDYWFEVIAIGVNSSGNNDGINAPLTGSPAGMTGCTPFYITPTRTSFTLDSGDLPTQATMSSQVTISEPKNGGGFIAIPMCDTRDIYVKHRDGSITESAGYGKSDCENMSSTLSYTGEVGAVTADAGDYVCGSITAQPAQGIIYRNGSIAVTVGSQTDPANPCILIQHEPYFKVYNGDVAAGGGFQQTATTCSSGGNGLILGWNKTAAGFTGAGTQYAALALNNILGVGTSDGGGTNASSPTGLAFANNPGTSSSPTVDANAEQYGGSFPGTGSMPCIPDYFATSQDQTLTSVSGTISVNSLNGNYMASGGLTGLSGSVGSTSGTGNQVTIYATGNVFITGNIVFGSGNDTWTNVSQIPLFRLIVKGGNIYISNAVQRLDGIYIAEPSDDGSTGGTIYTCTEATDLGGDGAHNTAYDNCGGAGQNDTLTVNGAFVGQDVLLLRTKGTVSQSSGTVVTPAVPSLNLSYTSNGCNGGTLSPCNNSSNTACPSGYTATQLLEDAAPSWNDNFLCSPTNWNFFYTEGYGKVGYPQPPGGYDCTLIKGPSYQPAWQDDALCAPSSENLQLQFSNVGPVAGKDCVGIAENADFSFDGTYWMTGNTFLCYRKGSPAVYAPSSASAAEIFNFTPAVWLRQPTPQDGSTVVSSDVDAITSLPPIL